MRLIILDRDGVINEDSADYIKSPEEWIPIPGSLEAIARLCRAEFRIVIITNQSGIGRGLFTIDTLNRIHTRMLEHIRQKGGEIDAIMVCPHTPGDNCDCRKPKPGMFIELAQRLKINLHGVPAVGDSIRDLEAAQAAEASPILVKTGNGLPSMEVSSGQGSLGTISVFDDLAAFANDFLRKARDQVQL